MGAFMGFPKRFAFAAAALVLVASSARGGAEQVVKRVAGSDTLARNGSGAITGQAFVITIRGEVTYAARAPIWMFPATASTAPAYEKLTRHGQTIAALEPETRKLATKVVADENGRFEFAGLPPGEYYLVSRLTPGVHTGYAMQRWGVVLHNQVPVRAGESSAVSLTAQVQPGVGFP